MFGMASFRARHSSPMRISRSSNTSSSETDDTAAPRFGCRVTSPSLSNCRNASRTGIRLVPKRLASSSWRSCVPAARSPSKIALRKPSLTTSGADDFETSAVRMVFAAPGRLSGGVLERRFFFDDVPFFMMRESPPLMPDCDSQAYKIALRFMQQRRIPARTGRVEQLLIRSRNGRVGRVQNDLLQGRAYRKLEIDAPRRDRRFEPLAIDLLEIAGTEHIGQRSVHQLLEAGIVTAHHDRIGLHGKIFGRDGVDRRIVGVRHQ